MLAGMIRRIFKAMLIVSLTVPLMGCPNPFGDANDDNQWSDDRANREGKQRWADRDKLVAGLFLIAVIGGLSFPRNKRPIVDLTAIKRWPLVSLS